jgi:hypothetical protein
MEDKVSDILIKFMAEHSFKAPSNWDGTREVDI